MFAEQLGIELNYEKCFVEVDSFISSVKSFFDEGGQGLNVSVPFKEQAFQISNHLSERAKVAGSVNTLKQHSDGSLFGDNTDGLGFELDLVKNLQWSIDRKNVLLIGAGGAARGILMNLLSLNPNKIHIFNRTSERAELLASEFTEHGNIKSCLIQDLEEENGFDFIINATSASLQNTEIALPASVISETSSCYDLAYASSVTPFLAWASLRGASISDGLGMLVEQAAESFFIWLGERPETEYVIDHLRNIN